MPVLLRRRCKAREHIYHVYECLRLTRLFTWTIPVRFNIQPYAWLSLTLCILQNENLHTIHWHSRNQQFSTILNNPCSGRLDGVIVAIEMNRIRVTSDVDVAPYQWFEHSTSYGHTSPEDGVHIALFYWYRQHYQTSRRCCIISMINLHVV